MEPTVDQLLIKFGNPGTYQILSLGLLWIAIFPLAFHNMNSIFTVRTFEHHCKLPENWTASFNDSIPRILNEENETVAFDQCNMYKDPTNHSQGTTKCGSGYIHYPNDREWTIVQEWDLVCERNYLASLATSLYFTGVTLGGPVGGWMTDRFGRRKVILVLLYSQLAISISISFSNSYASFVALRIIQGFLLQGLFTATYTLAVELFQPSMRTAVAVICQTVWPTSLAILSLFSYWLCFWNYIFLALSVPGIITIIYVWLLPESVRWLISSNRIQKARTELLRFSSFNKIPLPENLEDDLQALCQRFPAQIVKKGEYNKYITNYDFRDLFRHGRMRLITFICLYLHFAAVFIYYGVTYAIPSLGSDIYLVFAVSAIIEFAITIVMYFILGRFGRKKVSIVCLVGASFLCIITVLLKYFLSADLPYFQTITMCTATLGKTFIAAYFTCIPMYSNELFPTVLRSQGIGVCLCVGRLAGMIAPQVLLLELFVWQPLPFILFAAVAFVAGIITLFLPETLNKPLPETPDDLRKLWMN